MPSSTPDPARVDWLLQFILAAAGQEDEFRDRELGRIHLLKYAYLADVAYAERHGGKTFTGVQWRFHQFGPWEPQVFDRIEPALAAVHATRKNVPSAKYGDFIRYSLQDEVLLDRLERQLPGEVLGAVRFAVREFGSDTASLLRHVYSTAPMLRAAPGEVLQFSDANESASTLDLDAIPVRYQEQPLPAVAESAPGYAEESTAFSTIDEAMELTVPPPVSRAVRRKKQEAVTKLKTDIRRRLDAAKRRRAPAAPPRYDEVFFQGVEWLDALEGNPVEPMHGEAKFSDDIWKSPSRRGSDVS